MIFPPAEGILLFYALNQPPRNQRRDTLKNGTLRKKGEFMKKIIGIIFISLMFANIGFAEIRLIEEKTITEKWKQNVATICVDGYKFVTTKTIEGVSIVQFYFLQRGLNRVVKC